MKLAIEGGTPVRSKPLPPNYPGAMVMGDEEFEGVASIVQSQSLFRYYGPNVQNAVTDFENMMAEKLKMPYVLGVSSGTAALVVALKALGIGYGDKVIVPANTFIATAGAVVCSNAVPVFADVDDSLNVDPEDLERVIDEEVKAIVAVPILGNPCDMEPIMDIATKYGLYVIEDVAQSCGATYKGEYVGTIGHISTFSFQINKILTAGEGGAVATRSRKFFERAVRYHDQGMFRDKGRYGWDSPEETNACIGQNYRMNELTGAVLQEQWNKLDRVVAKMRTTWRTIREALSAELTNITFRTSVDEAGDIGSNLGIILPSADVANQFTQALQAENIQVSTLYGGKPVYMAPQIFQQRTLERDRFPFNYLFKNPVVYSEDMCPRACDLMPRTVYLPISPLLTEQDAGEIVRGVVKVFKGLGI